MKRFQTTLIAAALMTSAGLLAGGNACDTANFRHVFNLKTCCVGSTNLLTSDKSGDKPPRRLLRFF